MSHWPGTYCRREQNPDNTRTAVVEACRYEPLLHRTYQEMAEHYGTVILPARIKKPRDKELVSYCA